MLHSEFEKSLLVEQDEKKVIEQFKVLLGDRLVLLITGLNKQYTFIYVTRRSAYISCGSRVYAQVLGTLYNH